MNLSWNLILQLPQLLQRAPKHISPLVHLNWREAWNSSRLHISHVLTVCLMLNGRHGMVLPPLHATRHGQPMGDKWPVHVKCAVFASIIFNHYTHFCTSHSPHKLKTIIYSSFFSTLFFLHYLGLSIY